MLYYGQAEAVLTKVRKCNMKKALMFLLIVAALASAYSIGRIQSQKVEPKLESAQTTQLDISPTPEPTSTPTPTPSPTNVPVKKTTNTTNCDKIIGDLMDQYHNLYTVDDILISSNKECHYHLLRQNNLVVNDGHIRDQLQKKPNSASGTLGSGSSSTSNNNSGIGTQQVSGLAYYSLGSGHWVSKNIESGKYIKLEDGSLWEISPLDKINTILWLILDNITVTESSNLLYPYLLVNTDDNETAEAKLIAK